MSNRTIVAIEPGIEDIARIRLLKAPSNIPDAEKPKPFTFDPDQISQWGQADAVKVHGETILDMLKNAHPAVKEALNDALKAPHGDVRSIYIKIIGGTDAERLYWETLYDGQTSFIALDNRWPIARIADSVIDIPIMNHLITMPLRLMAFISALGVKGELEWKSLYQSAEKSRQQGLPVEISVFVGENKLLDSIRAEIDANTITGVTVSPIPDRTSKIEKALNDYEPQIVHFFCHGSASLGVTELQLATIPDHLQGSETSSIHLGITDLANELRNNNDVWLVTLNCCEGARATGDLHSMAHSLVAAGIPAALGSLEPIDALDAHQFCETFYPALFDNILKLLPQLNAGKEVELEWATALRPPRVAISERHGGNPQNYRQWALPVLYVRQEQFNIRKPGANPIYKDVLKDMKIRAETVAEMLRSLPPETPMELRENILAMLDALPASLRPDTNGNFTSDDI